MRTIVETQMPNASSSPTGPSHESRYDLDLIPQDIAPLTSVDAIAAFVQRLGYPTDARTRLEPRGKAFIEHAFAPSFGSANDLFNYFMFRESEMFKFAPGRSG